MTAPDFKFSDDGGQTCLKVSGDWTIATIGGVERRLREALTPGQSGLILDLADLSSLDTAGAFILDQAMRQMSEDRPSYLGADASVLQLLDQAHGLATQVEDAPAKKTDSQGWVDLLDRTGRGAFHFWKESLESLSFLGATLSAMASSLINPRRMRWKALVSIIEETGLDAVPIVAFLSFFVGLVMAYIGASSLAALGASIFVVEGIGFGLLRELSGVLVAIIVAGRTNSAFTAQIGSMKMRQEVDAMTTLGLDPMRVLVAPRVLAMMIVLPVLTMIGMLTGLAGGVTVSWLVLDITPTVFFNRMQEFVPVTQFWIGMSKAPVFGLVIALIGCRQGLEVGGSVQSLGDHTIKSVVQSIFAIIVIDALFAILYMELGL